MTITDRERIYLLRTIKELNKNEDLIGAMLSRTPLAPMIRSGEFSEKEALTLIEHCKKFSLLNEEEE